LTFDGDPKMEMQTRSAMNTYRFFAVDEFDHVTSLLWRECTGDAEAKAVAESLVSQRAGIEVWDIGRLVSKLPCADRPTG
jgi:hypothetical protein